MDTTPTPLTLMCPGQHAPVVVVSVRVVVVSVVVVLVLKVSVVEVLVALVVVVLVVVVVVVVVLVVKKIGLLMASTEKPLNFTESMHACCDSERQGPCLSGPAPSSQSMSFEPQ